MYLIIFAIVFSAISNLHAQDGCKGQSIHDFYSKAQKSHPLSLENDKKIQISKSRIDIAKERPNPEINFEYLRGDQFGLEVNTYSLSAGHVFEFGSKRDKRLKVAKLQNEIETKNVKLQNLSIQMKSLLSFQRLGQIEISIENMEEAISTFKKILKRLNSRRQLNPEERVSVSTLALAINDYEARLNDLVNQKMEFRGELEFITNCSEYSAKYQLLNYANAINGLDVSKEGLTAIEKLKPDFSQAEFEKEKSQGYSNIVVGPLVEYQNQGNDEFVSAGVTLSFDLPLFNTNDGGKRNALKKWQAQKIISKNNLKKLEIKKKILIKNYKRSFFVLKKMPSLEALSKQHQEVEKLFSRGIISIPMVIESHRQHVDFLSSRFETENDLLESLEEMTLISGNGELIDNLLN